jgi:hypothetical protein
MIKRMTKATSLLVAAAAMISIVPASAADYTKIDSQDGTIYNAVAYKNGEFYIDGAVNNQDDATYYLANGKYNALSNVDSGSSADAYGANYVDTQDGDYFVDLDNGQVTSDSVKSNAEDDAASALRKNIKKDNDGRFDTTDVATIKDLSGKELKGNKFTDLWYGVTYTLKGASTPSLNVYTDANGNYIDADYNLGSIKVTTTASGFTGEKNVTVSNTKDQYDGAGGTQTVSASVSNENVIGQDANYIYRTAKVTVTATAGTITKIDGKAITAASGLGTTQVSFPVIQKISKTQASDSVDGAKYAKSVTTYVVSDKNGAAEAFDNTTYDNFTIANGKIVGYKADGAGKLKARTATLTSTDGLYYVDLADESSEDVKVNGSKSAVDTDVNGNLWRLDAGYIYKWNNDADWTKVYKVDGSFDQMSVYDANDIVAWNQTDEVYSVIGNKEETTTPAPVDTTPTPVVNKGWVKTDAGWNFYNATGAQVKGQWVNDGGVWYYIKADGVMATGWVNDNGTWYFLQSSGAMKTGWLNDNGTWYFLQSSGAMKTGWLNDNGTWYYLNASGAMLANTTVDGYKLNASGAWVK